MTATYRPPPGRGPIDWRPGEAIDLRDGIGPHAEPMVLTVSWVAPDAGGAATVYGVDQAGRHRTVFVAAPRCAGPAPK
ncbi:hypothetical protein [Catellatospora sp. NPDC049609]|uniref:hypothetical protein n=1 Tax=Catellatospora sp. NPDC049609 TaxID=3155505 RepID=UPI0034427399